MHSYSARSESDDVTLPILRRVPSLPRSMSVLITSPHLPTYGVEVNHKFTNPLLVGTLLHFNCNTDSNHLSPVAQLAKIATESLDAGSNACSPSPCVDDRQ